MKKIWTMTASLAFGVALQAASAEEHESSAGDGAVKVECHKGSSLIQLSISNHRRIGKVRIEVRSEDGRTLYIEEGKALTGELVRRLDRGVLPRGTHTILVTTRDITASERIVCE